MGVVVALTMAVTAAIVTQRQYAAMMGQVTDYGASLAKFLAVENAESTLAKEWVKLAISVRAIMERQTFHEISIADRQGVVRASSLNGVVDKPYALPPGAKQLARRADGVIVRTYTGPDGVTVLHFEEPITYHSIEVGRLYFGLLEEPLSRVARQSFGWLTLLIVVTVLAVMAATYFMAEHYSKALRLLRESLSEVGKGRLDYRIAEDRNDELGQVYRSFDSMAQALQKRSEPEEVRPPPV
jgi:serine/threonine-protein kinase